MQSLDLRVKTNPVCLAGELAPGVNGIYRSRHAMLRSLTRDAHARTDRVITAAGIFESANRFVLYLRAMESFHSAYAQAIGATDEAGWCRLWNIDRHSHWIAEDIEAANADLLTSAAFVPQADNAAFLLSERSALLGSLYVIAGSSLGARVLHTLTVRREIPDAGGSRYLGQLSKSLRWNEFIDFLECVDIDNESEMVAGALATFESVCRHVQHAVNA